VVTGRSPVLFQRSDASHTRTDSYGSFTQLLLLLRLLDYFPSDLQTAAGSCQPEGNTAAGAGNWSSLCASQDLCCATTTAPRCLPAIRRAAMWCVLSRDNINDRPTWNQLRLILFSDRTKAKTTHAL